VCELQNRDTRVDDFTQISAQLEATVREAGVLARGMFGASLKNWTKGPRNRRSRKLTSPSTISYARGSHAGNDGIAWLSEESVDDPARLAARQVWIVDPIDGTRAYIAGFPDWAVSAALVADGRPVVACLYAPVTEQFFVARANGGATLQRHLDRSDARGRNSMTPRIAGPRRAPRTADRYGAALHRNAAGCVRWRSASRRSRTAPATSPFGRRQQPDWDLAAADLLVHEAGGALTSITRRDCDL